MRKPESYRESGVESLRFGLEGLLEGRGVGKPRKHGLFGGAKTTSPGLVELDAESLLEAARALGPEGSILYYFPATDSPSMVMLAAPEAVSEGEEALAKLRSLGKLDRDQGGLSLKVKATEAAVSLISFRVGGGRSYSARAGRLIIHLQDDAATAIAAGISGASLGAQAATGAAQPAAFHIERNSDFMLGQFLLPPAFPSRPALPGGQAGPRATVFWQSLDLSATGLTTGTWFVGSIGEGREAVICPFLVEGGDEAMLARVEACLAQGWMRSARRLGALLARGAAPSTQPPIRFGRASREDAGLAAEWPCAHAMIQVSVASFSVGIAIAPRLAGLLRSAGSEALVSEAEGMGAPAKALADLVAANESFLLRWEGKRFDAWLTPVADGGLPALGPLLAALGPRDASLVLQNQVIPELGAAALPGLLLWRARNGDRELLVPLVPFDEAALTALLPENAIEEWPASRAPESLSPIAAQSVSDSAAACARLNASCLASIAGALRGKRLQLSPGARSLLQARVLAPLEAKDRRALEALVASDRPFGFLVSRPPRLGRYLVDRLPNKSLALAMAGGPVRMEAFAASMGAGRLRDFQEELEAVDRRYKRGDIAPRELVDAREYLERRMTELVEALEEEEGRAARPNPDRSKEGK